MRNLIALFFVVLVLFIASRCSAAEAGPVTHSCYFLATPSISLNTTRADCVGFRDEAEDYLFKSHQSCTSVVYIVWQGTRETVRCSNADYVSGADGNLRPAP